MTSSLKLLLWRTQDFVIFRVHSASTHVVLAVGVFQRSLIELISPVEDFKVMTT